MALSASKLQVTYPTVMRIIMSKKNSEKDKKYIFRASILIDDLFVFKKLTFFAIRLLLKNSFLP